MSDITNPSFKINNIKFPKIDFSFHADPKGDNYNQAFRVGIEIQSNRKALVLMGISLESTSKVGSDPSAKLVVEAICETEFNQDLGKIASLQDIPLAANILAQLLPFIREKVNYCFSNNQIILILPPMNLHALVATLTQETGLLVLDKRVSADAV